MDFLNKTVLITGASTGIGRACALAFSRRGATVYANYLKKDEQLASLEKIVENEELELIPLQANVCIKTDIDEMFARIFSQQKTLDILINNAGISSITPFLDISECEWDNIITTNLKSVFLCSQAALKKMAEQKRGVIVNVASELGFSGRDKFASYCASKGGIISLTRSLALEFAPEISINGIAPGPTSTPLLEKELATPGHAEDIQDIPMARYASPEEIAESILFLASDKAKFYCGEIISPNGGTVMR